MLFKTKKIIYEKKIIEISCICNYIYEKKSQGGGVLEAVDNTINYNYESYQYKHIY